MAGFEESDSAPTAPHADPRGDPFLRTRFAIPARPAMFLRRDRLVRHLDRSCPTPLTMVNGAAGAGKTLLVADWATGRTEPLAWLTTEATDQQPAMFWAYFLQALRASGMPLSAELSCPAEAAGATDAGRVDHPLLARLAAELSARDLPVTVVLDQYDRVTDQVIAEQLEFVLHHAGAGLRLILVTRTEPLLPLHRYRAAGDMTEIRDAELAFTPQEAAVLLETHGLRVPLHVASALVDRTRGWAAGLRLCALAAKESPNPERYLKEFEADRSTVADFLLAEVLKRQTPETQDLLLKVSVLDGFSPALANALTERADAEPLLAGLCRENAFVEDLGHSRYRLHPLFGEILRAHLRMRSPGLEPALHRRAAAWLRSSGSLAETLGHGVAAGDWDFTAGALVDDLAIGELFTGPRSDDLAALFAPMGPEATSPAADLVRAARELSRSDLEHGLTHLGRARRSLEGLEGSDGLAESEGDGRPPDEAPGPVAARLSCELLEALAARLTGSPGRAEMAARAAEGLREEIPAHLLDRHPEVTALLLTHLGSTRLWAGRFEDARAALSTVTESPGTAVTAAAREECLGRLALIDYLDGWLCRAEHKALEATTTAATMATAAAGTEGPRPAQPPDAAHPTGRALPPGAAHPSGLAQAPPSGMARLVLAAVAVERGELSHAQALLDTTDGPDGRGGRAGRGGRRGRGGSEGDPLDPVTEASRVIVAARLLLARGKPSAALAAVESAVRADVVSPWAQGHAALIASAAHLAEGRPETAVKLLQAVPDVQAACVVGAARAQLAAGRPDEAIDLLDRVRPEGRTGPAVTVRATLVRAEAAARTGDAAASRGLVAQALREARRERLRRPFLEVGAWIRPSLDTAPLRVLAAGWLVPGAQRPVEAPRSEDRRPPMVVEELSGRERDVLQRLARTMSTEEIAADLYVSVNTVKTHLKSVYRKLAVNRRNEAVRRARELHLL
ncbi:LuxR C-terminal-related transcriptional regulator [Streptomyces tauricus]|uniref:LuxR C-terminal-related transcriptional regulator n=1 Tax=Streptomyces tauricus TaxID=68274 RepID=UPI003825C95E